MFINTSSEDRQTFREVTNGSVISIDKLVLMKTPALNFMDGQGDRYNSVNLLNGSYHYIDPNKVVIVHPRAVLDLEPR